MLQDSGEAEIAVDNLEEQDSFMDGSHNQTGASTAADSSPADMNTTNEQSLNTTTGSSGINVTNSPTADADGEPQPCNEV